jgi:polysaccharide pyruvyl transferase WcaK-like protein
MDTKKIGLLHGAILNSGDYLICKRSTELLKRFLDQNKFELIPIERWNSFEGNFDALIILGGPIVSRTLHMQSKNIIKYLNNKKIPIIALGIGISGEYYNNIEHYFDDESFKFWNGLYESSGLISVRDKQTYSLFKHFNIKTKLTGCPALFDLNNIKKLDKGFQTKKEKKIKISLTIPDLSITSFNIFHILYNIKNLFLSVFFMSYLKINFGYNKINNEYNLILQHGFNPLINIICIYSKLLGFEPIDASRRSLDEIKHINYSNIHIGTRLHSNILFLSAGKPSYLFNIDNRTKAFLDTFDKSCINFSLLGIIKLVNLASNEIKNNIIKDNTIKFNKKLDMYFKEMSTFLLEVKKFLEFNL